MTTSKAIKTLVLTAAVLGLCAPEALATCGEFGGFPIFQCANLAYFQKVPDPNFVIQIDPNILDPLDPGFGRIINITAVFWQLGFGNNNLNTGNGSQGTGNSGLTTFNGNDGGIKRIDLIEGRQLDTRFPAGAVCLRNNNWGDSGIDGCADDDRTTALNTNNDDILNPYYSVYYSRQSSPGYYSLNWHQDYPMAVLLKTNDGKFFAIAAVANERRGNTGNGDGIADPGENVFADVSPWGPLATAVRCQRPQHAHGHIATQSQRNREQGIKITTGNVRPRLTAIRGL